MVDDRSFMIFALCPEIISTGLFLRMGNDMNEFLIKSMSKEELERYWSDFDFDQLKWAMERAIELLNKD